MDRLRVTISQHFLTNYDRLITMNESQGDMKVKLEVLLSSYDPVFSFFPFLPSSAFFCFFRSPSGREGSSSKSLSSFEGCECGEFRVGEVHCVVVKKNRDLLCKQKDDMDSKDYPYTPNTYS